VNGNDAPVVVKIGGSTLGQHDTTLDDLVAYQRAGGRAVVVHGGGSKISDWLRMLNLPSHFVRGLRVTDAATLEVVVAVLAGLVNKQLVVDLALRGAPAVGLSGADGALVTAAVEDPELGYVGRVEAIDPAPLSAVIEAGYLPVVAPIGLARNGIGAQILNINADTVAGEIARALPGAILVFLTDVPAVRDAEGRDLSELDAEAAAAMLASGAIAGGMIPKVEACRRVTEGGGTARIVDGRAPGALAAALAGRGGTAFKGDGR
jgi:acetylglutamate kinase